MKVIDMHCDVISKLYELKLKGKIGDNTLRKNNLSVDLEKLSKGNYFIQFLSLFIEGKKGEECYSYCMQILKHYTEELEKNKELIISIKNRQDLVNLCNDSRIGTVLTIEEGGALCGDMKKLYEFYNLGVRLITLTWNFPNEIGFPNFKFIHKDKGLTDFGKELVREMNRLGVIIDVSHLSDCGFWDVIALSNSPIVASHSNARAVTNHPRNLTDDMIKAIGNNGGVIGLNFCSDFLGKSSVARLDDMINHVKHIYNVGGSGILAIGSDFDGIENEVEIKDSSEMSKLYFSLKAAGFTNEDIEKIMNKNAFRILEENLK